VKFLAIELDNDKKFILKKDNELNFLRFLTGGKFEYFEIGGSFDVKLGPLSRFLN